MFTLLLCLLCMLVQSHSYVIEIDGDTRMFTIGDNKEVFITGNQITIVDFNKKLMFVKAPGKCLVVPLDHLNTPPAPNKFQGVYNAILKEGKATPSITIKVHQVSLKKADEAYIRNMCHTKSITMTAVNKNHKEKRQKRHHEKETTKTTIKQGGVTITIETTTTKE